MQDHPVKLAEIAIREIDAQAMAKDLVELTETVASSTMDYAANQCTAAGVPCDPPHYESETLAFLRKYGNGTSGIQYRAELYDEVFAFARKMGFVNVTEAMTHAKQVEALGPKPFAFVLVDHDQTPHFAELCIAHDPESLDAEADADEGVTIRPVYLDPNGVIADLKSRLEKLGPLLELLGKVAECAHWACEDGEELPNGDAHFEAATYGRLCDSLNAMDALPDVGDEYVRDGWLTALQTARNLLVV